MLLPDEGTAEHYGDLKAELARLGKPIPDNDLWVAAMARQYDLPLATRDAHFAQVPGLQTLAWQPPSASKNACSTRLRDKANLRGLGVRGSTGRCRDTAALRRG